jgi:hypothetical protein
MNKVGSFAKRVLMIRPTNFYLNLEASADNKFMNSTTLSVAETTKLAQKEFDSLRYGLQNAGVEVECYD